MRVNVTRGLLRRIRKWSGNDQRERIPSYALTRGALPIVRDNYRINKFTSRRNAHNISTSAKWYRDTVVYHQGSYSPRPVTHCRAYVVSRYPFGSYPPRCSMARIVRHARSTPFEKLRVFIRESFRRCARKGTGRGPPLETVVVRVYLRVNFNRKLHRAVKPAIQQHAHNTNSRPNYFNAFPQ